MDKLSLLLAKCQNSVFLHVNEHRGCHQSTADRVAELRLDHQGANIEEEVYAKMIEADTVVELQFYPRTSIGFYLIYDSSLESALDRALATFPPEERS